MWRWLSNTTEDDCEEETIDTPVFDALRFIDKAEQVTFRTHREGDEEIEEDLPETLSFRDFIAEVILLFDSLGKVGFNFIKNDIVSKIGIIMNIYDEDPDANQTLQQMVEREMAEDCTRVPASGSRTLLRLMWGVEFIRVLLDEMGHNDEMATKEGLRIAYNKVLYEHHPWVVRQAVSMAVHLAPSRETFLASLGLDMSKKDEYLNRLLPALTRTSQKMYAFYERHSLLDLP